MKARLLDLSEMHPCLLWDDIILAAAALLTSHSEVALRRVQFDVVDVPGFGSETIQLEVDLSGIVKSEVAKLRKTYEAHRLVELAAIGIAGLMVSVAGGHQIRDVALRGMNADYLVDEELHLLEVAGRSRRRDFQIAWDERWAKLSQREGEHFFLCVTEFETPYGRLRFGAGHEEVEA